MAKHLLPESQVGFSGGLVREFDIQNRGVGLLQSIVRMISLHSVW